MESGLMMILHSALLGILLYLVLFYVLKQKQVVSENRAILFFAVALIYMILFGHKLPYSLNKNI